MFRFPFHRKYSRNFPGMTLLSVLQIEVLNNNYSSIIAQDRVRLHKIANDRERNCYMNDPFRILGPIFESDRARS